MIKANRYSIEKILFSVLLISCSIQNKSFSSIATLDLGFIRMDILDITIITAIMLLLMLFIAYKKIKFKFSIIDMFAIIYFIFLIILGLIKGYSIFNMFLDIRVLIYLFGSFIIYKYSGLNDEYFIKLIKACGFLNSFIYIFTFVNNLINTGQFVRDVSFNLFIGSLALGIIIFDKNNKSFLDKVIILFILIASLISQQRSVIIPNIIVLICYVLRIITNRRDSIVNKLMAIFFITILLYVMVNMIISLGFKETILSRFNMENFLGKQSTLWMRTNSIVESFKDLSMFEIIAGTGIGSIVKYYPEYGVLEITDALEMFFFNYIYKYGIFGTIILILFFINKIYIHKMKIKNNNLSSVVLKSLLIILVGGFISGLERYQGQYLLGMCTGLILKCYKRV